MTEPDVALTDYALAVECAVFTLMLLQHHRHPHGLRFWFLLFFASVSAASILGGTVHGFFVDESTRGYAILWPATMLAIGVTSLAAWAIGVTLLFARRIARRVIAALVVAFAVYAGVVLFRSQDFRVVILNSVPAVLFLIAVLIWKFQREPHKCFVLAAAGMVLNLVAGVLQQLEVGIHPDHFNHNAVYHVLQAVSLLLVFLGARRMIAIRDE